MRKKVHWYFTTLAFTSRYASCLFPSTYRICTIMIDKLSMHNAYNTVRKMIPCSVYIHSMIIIFVINFEKWDTQTQALDIKLFDIIKKHLLYTHQCIVQNTGRTKQWNTN